MHTEPYNFQGITNRLIQQLREFGFTDEMMDAMTETDWAAADYLSDETRSSFNMSPELYKAAQRMGMVR